MSAPLPGFPGVPPRSGRSPLATRALVTLLLLVPAGCSTTRDIVLYQPTAPRAQRRIELTGGHYAFAGDAGRRRFVLDFPLPGSRSGPSDFRLFLSAPALDEMTPISPGDEAAGRGFLLQTIGLRRGKTVFTGGYVRVRSLWLTQDTVRLDLEIDCADDTRISGSVFVKARPETVRAFEQRYAADIAALRVDAAATTADASAAAEGASPASASATPPASQPSGSAEAPRFLAPPP